MESGNDRVLIPTKKLPLAVGSEQLPSVDTLLTDSLWDAKHTQSHHRERFLCDSGNDLLGQFPQSIASSMAPSG